MLPSQIQRQDRNRAPSLGFPRCGHSKKSPFFVSRVRKSPLALCSLVVDNRMRDSLGSMALQEVGSEPKVFLFLLISVCFTVLYFLRSLHSGKNQGVLCTKTSCKPLGLAVLLQETCRKKVVKKHPPQSPAGAMLVSEGHASGAVLI